MKGLVKALDDCLPQTQCGDCGYAGCLPYAEAMAAGAAPVNRCPPGGEKTLRQLAALLDVEAETQLEGFQSRSAAKAVIREAECIGCTKCIQACPVDAIIGSAKRMHVILAHECTGCGLCVAPCPVDCIEMEALPEPLYQPEQARAHYQARQLRLRKEVQAQQALYHEKRRLAAASQDKQADNLAKQDYIRQALARVKAKQGGT